MISSADRTFTLRTGEYEVAYEPEPGRKLGAGISIRRVGAGVAGAAILTRMAHGPSFNVTDYGTYVGYDHKPSDKKKDFDIFRTMQCRDLPNSIEVTIQTSRTWADFTGTLTAYRDTPGLLHWTVRAHARQSKSVDEAPLPDCEFRLNGMLAQHQVVRHMVQRGPVTGMLFFRDNDMQTDAMYWEDFTSLSRLYELTGAANPWHGYTETEQRGAVRMGPAVSEFQLAEVGGVQQAPAAYRETVERYDRFGYLRPENFHIPQGENLIVADTYLYLRPSIKNDNVDACRTFTELAATIYSRIRKPVPTVTNWAGDIAPRLISDILRPDNSHVANGHFYPRAYVKYEYPDTQLWTISQLLLPLTEYCKLHPVQKQAAALKSKLEETLPVFWDEKWKGFANDPAPVPDMYYTGVYLLNPVYQMADLAVAGIPEARRMILGYRSHLIEMGRSCGYVFADISTSNPKKQQSLYQYDTTCMYIYIMMRLYQLSSSKDFDALNAAREAAERLADRRLDLCWEINQTAIGAPACEMLYKATGDRKYHDLAWIPIANTLRWAWLWQGYYGIGKHLTTFWAFSGTPANPHSCEYENHQVRRFIKQYVELAGSSLSPQVRNMLNDCWQLGPCQTHFALPPNIVKAGARQFLANAHESDCGTIDYDQVVPLEDYHGGWGTDMEWYQGNTKLGQIGQEIYGAGGILWYAVWQKELDAALRERGAK